MQKNKYIEEVRDLYHHFKSNMDCSSSSVVEASTKSFPQPKPFKVMPIVEELETPFQQAIDWQPTTKQQIVLLQIQQKIDQYLYSQKYRFNKSTQSLSFEKIKYFLNEINGYFITWDILQRLMKINPKLYKIINAGGICIVKPLNLLSDEEIWKRKQATKAKMKKIIQKEKNQEQRTLL